MTALFNFQIATYTIAGELRRTNQIELNREADGVNAELSNQLSQLSFDIDLPLELIFEGDPKVVLRICATESAAYAIYYVADRACFASLILTGNDDELDFELMQTFRYLLLDESDDDDPSEESIMELLNQEAFEFFQIEERPVVHRIWLSEESADVILRLERTDQQVAVAYMGLPQVGLI
ncbi:MAG: hypothetical protein AAFN77_16750 [Planctomycetota bacterium]